jgi:predicted dehydrogenase
LEAVVNRTGHSAQSVAQQFGARYATTDVEAVLGDPAVDALLIATRHDSHAHLALAGLRAGKHVLVEKPLALAEHDLERIEEIFAAAGSCADRILLAGFNRRFSPHSRRLRELTRGRREPMILNYRMNAGYVPLDHWVHGDEGGGRNIGEACHVYDLFTYLTDSQVTRVTALPIRPQGGYYSPRDNFVATLAFADGSVATLTYTALGSSRFPKERLEVFVDGNVFVLDEYKSLAVHGAKAAGLKTRLAEKGHKEELLAFAQAIREGGEWPLPLWQQLQATRISFQVEALLGPQGHPDYHPGALPPTNGSLSELEV